MTDEKKNCSRIDHPNIAPGFGCCQCHTYNGDQRTNCKHCGHVRCDNPTVKHIPIEMPDGTISIRPVAVPTDPKKAN